MANESYIDKIKLINNSFKTRNFLPFYFLYGEEDFYLYNIKKSAISYFDDESKLNIRIYDKNNFEINEAISYLGNLPVFNEKKLIIFDNVDYFKNKYSGKNNINQNDDFLKALDYNKDMNIVLFLFFETDNNYNKNFTSNYLANYINKTGITLNLTKLNDKDTFSIVESRFKKSKVNIDKLDIAYLIRVCGYSLSNLYNEIDKLIAYVGERRTISKDDIESIVTKSLDNSVFTLLKLYNEKKNEKALMFYGDLLSEGSYDKDAIFMIFASQFSNLIVCKDLMLKNKSAKEISDIMGLQFWRVKDLIEANKYTDIEVLKNKLKEITNLTINRINGNISEDFMLLLLMDKV